MLSPRFLAVLIGVLSVPVSAFAHVSGQSFEKLTDTYFVDIGYDIPFEVGEETLLDFGLFTVKDGKPDWLANFTNLTLSIHSGSTVLHTKSVDKPEFGKVFVVVTPKRDGHWTLTADFTASGKVLESASFDFSIAPATHDSTGLSDTSVLILIIIVLSFSAFFILKKKRHLLP